MIRRLLLLLITLILIFTACSPVSEADINPTTVLEDPTQAPESTATEISPTEVKPTDTSEPIPTATEKTEVEDAEKILIDDLGREIIFTGYPQRIVTLGPSSLESLFAIGAGSQVVGREEFSTYPEEALEVTSVGSLFGELPTEVILALEPDLVITPEIISAEQVQAMEDLGLKVYFQANPVDFEGLWKNLRTLGSISGHEAEAEALISELENRIEIVNEKIELVSDRPTVFYELDATDPQNPYTIGSGTFIDTIISMAGGDNIGSVLDGAYAQISSEEVIAQNPELILLADAPYGITPESVAERAGWEGITAIINNQVYPFDPFLVSVPGPRLVEGLETMATIIHPEVFK